MVAPAAAPVAAAKRAILSTVGRGPGGRTIHEELLPYPRFLAMLQYILERKYEFVLDVEVPQKRNAAGSMGR